MSLILFLWSLVLILQANAQTSKLFQWGFSNNFLSTSLPSCLSLGITVKQFDPNNDTTSLFQAPFYMISFEVGGTPKTTLLGDTNTNLTWTVDHPVGSQLMLLVVDANGSSGGVPPNIFTVVNGQTTSCIQNNTASDFTVSANVTDTVQTCQPWGLRISGGVPPYNLTLAALNSPIVTNVTVPFGFDAFTYIDRADPNTQLIAGISDLTGRWAFGTPIVKTQGSPNVDCVGLVSSPGNSTQLAQAAQDEAAAAHKHTVSIIVGVTVTFGLLFLIALTFGVVTYMRRRAAKMIRRRTARAELDLTVKPFEEGSPTTPTPTQQESGQILSINNWIQGQPMTQSPTTVNTLSYTDEKVRPDSATSSSRPGFVNFPVRSLKSAHSATGSVDSARPLVSRGPSATSSNALPTEEGSSSGAVREYVIQHQDGGGAVVRELPPPYVDRTGTKEEEDVAGESSRS